MERGTDVAGRGAPLGEYFLARLVRLAEMRRAWLKLVDGEPPELLDYAMASTYADCVQLGVRDRARGLLGLWDADGACCGSRDE